MKRSTPGKSHQAASAAPRARPAQGHRVTRHAIVMGARAVGHGDAACLRARDRDVLVASTSAQTSDGPDIASISLAVSPMDPMVSTATMRDP